MKQISIYRIESKDLYKDYIWSNFNVVTDSKSRKYYRVNYKKISLLEIRCIRMNEYSLNLEIGVISIRKLCKVLVDLITFLKESNEKLLLISTYIVSDDKLGLWILKKAGFTVSAVWRECVEINNQKRDIKILSFECR